MTLFAVIGLLGIFIYLILHQYVAPAFDQLELDEARTNLVRAERAIRADVSHINSVAGDWAIWDDSYDYVSGNYPSFEDSNLDRPTLENLGLDLMAYYDTSHRLVWGLMLHEGRDKSLDLLGIFQQDTRTAELLIEHSDADERVDGLLQTNLDPMLISSWPIVRTDGSGPHAGSIIVGQFLTSDRIQDIRERTEAQLDIASIKSAADVDERLEVPINLAADGSIIHETTPTTINSTAVLADVFGMPLVFLNVSTQRDISALGNSTVQGALLFLAIAAAIVAIVIWLMLRAMIVLPLARLADHIVDVRESGDLTRKVKDPRNDEIGALSSEFDRLTQDLHEARKQLLDQSYKAGKAETAAEVLHNIRNAMTPLINGIDRLGRHFGATGKLKVRQAIEELTSPDCPPDRAEKLFQYIESAFDHIEASNEDASENLDVASRQARQVEAILADQERHAQVAPVIEKLSLDEVMDEAVLVIPASEDPAVEVDIESDLNARAVQAHRVSLLQVLGNVVLNAWESIQRSDHPDGRIRVVAREETINERPMVRVTVIDNGCGFDQETAGKIFQRGYSSKDGNLSGLGLHWCANALAGMGGRIQAESAGPGHGAEIHVLLPAAQGG
jgi:two-component system NtrC family sensor kinase